jgi:hypothetical protein
MDMVKKVMKRMEKQVWRDKTGKTAFHPFGRNSKGYQISFLMYPSGGEIPCLPHQTKQ